MRGVLLGLSMATAVFLASAPAQALTYKFSYDSTAVDIVNAQIVTNAQNIATAMTGTVIFPGNVSTTITGIIPTTNTTYKSLWTWDNVFLPTSPNVNLDGLLFGLADGNVANYFRQNGKYVLSVANPTTGVYTYYNNTATAGGTQTVQAVPLPPSVSLLGAGLVGVAGLNRRRKAPQHNRRRTDRA